MKIPFRTLVPEAGMEIGFDAQINDAKNGVRTGMAKWNDPTNNSWTDTFGWGIVTLVGP
jgi:endo-1,4-beta-xylanase